MDTIFLMALTTMSTAVVFGFIELRSVERELARTRAARQAASANVAQ